MLLFYYNQAQELSREHQKLSLEVFSKVIFKLNIEKVIIEYLFSIMNFKKDKKRSHFNDSTVSIIFHTHNNPPVTCDTQYGITSKYLTLYIERSLSNKSNRYQNFTLVMHTLKLY